MFQDSLLCFQDFVSRAIYIYCIRSTRAEKAIPALCRHIKQGATPSSQDIRGKGADLGIGTSNASKLLIRMEYACTPYGATFDRAEFALGSGLDRKNGSKGN
ncbi:hypothetical protein PCH_Pc18g06280 [Penicillium rubens Wisconsin 54-1255]|uniref:Uncharacterized protein n=1 Tax=Penicillium rubens (strain ATCC 28089 / DSM 1075 / NRRL 1951 / Wisconsin 54-1255) TaxID=500485 RepID=B6HCM4_PENRW|nr:hypothetical protein PCH_Pc18g06280 [Penicillium rubens Wisconsin 54-1255]